MLKPLAADHDAGFRPDMMPPVRFPVQMMGMLPGFSADMMPGGGGADADKQQQLQIKRHITIIESMTEKELDSTNVKFLQVLPLHRTACTPPSVLLVMLPNLQVLFPPGFDEGRIVRIGGETPIIDPLPPPLRCPVGVPSQEQSRIMRLARGSAHFLPSSVTDVLSPASRCFFAYRSRAVSCDWREAPGGRPTRWCSC